LISFARWDWVGEKLAGAEIGDHHATAIYPGTIRELQPSG
jgi:hypothetical protein